MEVRLKVVHFPSVVGPFDGRFLQLRDYIKKLTKKLGHEEVVTNYYAPKGQTSILSSLSEQLHVLRLRFHAFKVDDVRSHI